MSITFLDPRSVPTAAIEPYAATLHAPASGNVVIGLLANGFPDSEPFIKAVGVALQAINANISTTFVNKGNASAPASAALVDGMAAEVHAVGTGYGH
jgi:hypothetical protein